MHKHRPFPSPLLFPDYFCFLIATLVLLNAVPSIAATTAASVQESLPLYHLPITSTDFQTNTGSLGGKADIETIDKLAPKITTDPATQKTLLALPLNANAMLGPRLELPASDTRLRLDQPGQTLTFACFVKWTGPNKHPHKRHTLLSTLSRDQKTGYSVEITETGALQFCFARPNGMNRRVSGATLTAGQLAHIALVWTTGEKNALHFYINGVETEPTANGKPMRHTGDTPLAANTIPLCIGATNTNAYPLNGALADIRLYDHALLPDEIRALANPN